MKVFKTVQEYYTLYELWYQDEKIHFDLVNVISQDNDSIKFKEKNHGLTETLKVCQLESIPDAPLYKCYIIAKDLKEAQGKYKEILKSALKTEFSFHQSIADKYKNKIKKLGR